MIGQNYLSNGKRLRLTGIKCPLKPCITCAGTSELVESTPCPSCPAKRTSGRSSHSEPVRATLIGVIQSDHMGVR